MQAEERDPVAQAMRQYAEELTRWREHRNLSKGGLATLMTYDRSYVSQIEGCHLPPTEDFTRRAEAVLDTGGALWQRWETYEHGKGRRRNRPPGRSAWPAGQDRPRELQVTTLEFVAWIADHSRLSFEEAYEAVMARIARLRAGAPSVRHAVAHRRSRVTRDQLAHALVAYYNGSSEGEIGTTFYRARVGEAAITLSILLRPSWLRAAVRLDTDQERFRLTTPAVDVSDGPLEEPVVDAALHRVAEAEVAGTAFVNNPLYRLLDVTIERHRLEATVALTDFASYALTMDLLELELVDALTASGTQLSGRDSIHSSNSAARTPLRDLYLPTVPSALALGQRLCAGGPVCLLAIARGGTRRGGRDRDFLLVVQERSSRVLNVMSRLAVIPKAFHAPISDPSQEASLSASLERELEEELLGRQDLEQLSEASHRQGDPLHPNRLSEPIKWLVDRRQSDAYRAECVGFGINMVSGNYEFPCLIVIDDEEWWARYGGQVVANWEVARIRCYSSRDKAGLHALATDPGWSNEGLFAFLEGLRRLAELDTVSRLALPSIGVEV